MTTSRLFFVLGLLFIILGATAVYFSHKAEAPSAPIVTESVTVVDPGWKTYSDSTVSFRYPELTATYVHAMEWPPKVTVSEEVSSCEPTIINGHSYCVITTTEGAAGSIYIDYAYAMEKEGKGVTLSFTLRKPQCLNYDDPQKTACEEEQGSFDVNVLADRILQSVGIR